MGALHAGMQVGEYRIAKKLGEGGMGEVFLAVHATLGSNVVLKSLHPELMKHPELQGRFVREAEAMSRLKHPNIVQIFNFFQDAENAFIVMEFVDGQTVDDAIGQVGLIPPARAIEVMLPVLRAIEYAHQQGVIHRDLKPANIMVGRDGVVRVLDFGTAKVADRPGLTRVGTTLGTANYMPPEQIMGQELTSSVDLYALGVTLYEMCTGRLPFDSEDSAALVRKICTEAPIMPSVYYPAMPKSLEAAILGCLGKRPEQRYPSARALADALEAVAREIAPAPVPASPAAAVLGAESGQYVMQRTAPAVPVFAEGGADARAQVVADLARIARNGWIATALTAFAAVCVGAGTAMVGVGEGRHAMSLLVVGSANIFFATIVVGGLVLGALQRFLATLATVGPAAAAPAEAPPPQMMPSAVIRSTKQQQVWRYAAFDPNAAAKAAPAGKA